MVVLLPFKLLSIRKEIAKSRSPENVKRLLDLYENDILSVIEQATERGDLTKRDSGRLRSLTGILMNHLYSAYEEIREEIIMRDHSIELEVDKYIDKLEEQEELIAQKDEQLAEQSKQIAKQNDMLARKDDQIVSLEETVRQLSERLLQFED